MLKCFKYCESVEKCRKAWKIEKRKEKQKLSATGKLAKLLLEIEQRLLHILLLCEQKRKFSKLSASL